MNGERDAWGIAEQVLAGILDSVRVANWQRGGEGEPPEPLPRPGVRAGGIPLKAGDEVLGGKKPTTIEEMNARLGWKK